jgi:hypothetical protein
MVDQEFPTNRAADLVCTWCSAAITAETDVCPSCGAILNADDEPNVPGVTAVDAKAALQPPIKTPQSRNRIMSWISGDYPDGGTGPTESQALAPPDLEVQREMLRLELEAEVANLQAENDALLSEAAMEGRVIEIPDSIKPLLTGEALTEVENAIDENAEAEAAEAEGDAENAEGEVEAGGASAEAGAEPAEADRPAEADQPAEADDATTTEGNEPA